jgi:hypothetical protein
MRVLAHPVRPRRIQGALEGAVKPLRSAPNT